MKKDFSRGAVIPYSLHRKILKGEEYPQSVLQLDNASKRKLINSAYSLNSELALEAHIDSVTNGDINMSCIEDRFM